MAQKITINIIGKPYKMQVKSASEEHLMRVAAERLNANFKLYDDKFNVFDHCGRGKRRITRFAVEFVDGFGKLHWKNTE